MTLPDSVSERRLAIDDLDKTIVNLFASINAATYEVLALIREFDERAGWLRWGFDNCTQWLHWRCDLSPNAARERVRIAHALKPLSETSKAFASGALSYSKVRALIRVATPDNEAALLSYALEHTAARVEDRCQQLRNALPNSVNSTNRAFEARSLRVWRDAQRGTMILRVELLMESGELVCQALDQAVESTEGGGPESESVSWGAQQADALVSLAKEALGGHRPNHSSSSADNYQVVVHVNESALRGVVGRSDLSVETVKRLSCDGSIVAMVDGSEGEPLNVGRKQRTVPVALRRALWPRDQGCSFPGCTHRRYVDAHHVRHWSEGGETSLENTALLCSSHHRLVHEGGYDIVKDPLGQWYFQRPDGRAIPSHGYQPNDWIDIGVDDTGTVGEETHHCAELTPAYAWANVGNSVREPSIARYG